MYPVLQRRDGTIVVGSSDRLGRLHDEGLSLKPMGHAVESLYEDRAGRLWMGGDSGVWRLDGDRSVEGVRLPGGGAVGAILEGRDGRFWFGTRHGVSSFDGHRVINYTADQGLPDSPVEVLAEDRTGRIWAGTRAGLARFETDRFVTLTAKDGLAGDHVRSIYEDGDGVIWIGTFDSGLTRYENGHLTNYTVATGLFSSGVFQILEDARENFWISSNRGIYRVSRRQLNDFAAGRITAINSVAYGTQDGMRSAECNGGRSPAGFKSHDGRLWFPTQDGIVAIDPETVAYSTEPPLVGIEAAIVDRAPVDFDGGIRIGPGQSDLEIRYTAPSSVKAQHIQFRYMLEGLNDRWIDADTRRAVHYSHLPPGRYTFKIFAANSDGAWSRAPVSVPVFVRPVFYQTSWFFWGCLAAALGGAGGAYQLRLERLKANKQHLEQLVAERTGELQERTQALRVANELLEELATSDSVTGLANRRRFEAFLSQEWLRAARGRLPVSMLLIDLDQFKAYNDTYGHQQGDACLREISDVLRRATRRVTDLAARFGGEEFALVLGDTPLEGARTVAESIRDGLAARAIPHAGSTVSRVVTVSIGAATIEPDTHRTTADLIAACDQALYRAKAQGRNQCEVAVFES